MSHLDAEIGSLADETPIEALVEPEVSRSLGDGILRMEDAARRLAMSERTLQRRLFERVPSYQALVAATRRHVAENLLPDSLDTATEVAFLTRFSEQSAFNRDFKRWTGQSPVGFRTAVRRSDRSVPGGSSGARVKRVSEGADVDHTLCRDRRPCGDNLQEMAHEVIGTSGTRSAIKCGNVYVAPTVATSRAQAARRCRRNIDPESPRLRREIAAASWLHFPRASLTSSALDDSRRNLLLRHPEARSESTRRTLFRVAV